MFCYDQGNSLKEGKNACIFQGSLSFLSLTLPEWKRRPLSCLPARQQSGRITLCLWRDCCDRPARSGRLKRRIRGRNSAL